MARKSESRSPAVAALREELTEETAKLLARAQEAGAMRRDFTPGDVGTLFASIAGAIRSSETEEAWRRHVEFALDGLRA